MQMSAVGSSHSCFYLCVQVVQISRGDQMPDSLQNVLREFTERALSYLMGVAKGYGSQDASGHARFWKALLHKVYGILDKVCGDRDVSKAITDGFYILRSTIQPFVLKL